MKTESILYIIGAVLIILGALMRLFNYSAYSWLYILGSAAPIFAGIYMSRKKKEKVD